MQKGDGAFLCGFGSAASMIGFTGGDAPSLLLLMLLRSSSLKLKSEQGMFWCPKAAEDGHLDKLKEHISTNADWIGESCGR